MKYEINVYNYYKTTYHYLHICLVNFVANLSAIIRKVSAFSNALASSSLEMSFTAVLWLKTLNYIGKARIICHLVFSLEEDLAY